MMAVHPELLKSIEADAPHACQMAREWLRWRQTQPRSKALKDEIRRLHHRCQFASHERRIAAAIVAIMSREEAPEYAGLIFSASHQSLFTPPF